MNPGSTENKINTVLVTGGSSGIGLALAEVFAGRGHNLFLVARDAAGLEQAKAQLQQKYSVAIEIFAADLTKDQAPEAVWDYARSKGVKVDCLVNNAGFALYGNFAEHQLQAELNVIRLNNLALTALTGLFIKPMIAARRGWILNIASTAAFQPGPRMAVYYATKAYTLSFSEALRREVHESGIHVTCLCPGPTKTNFFIKMPAMAKTRLIQNGRMMDAHRVALAGYQALLRNKAVIIPGFINKFIAFGTRLLPRSLVAYISAQTLAQANQKRQ